MLARVIIGAALLSLTVGCSSSSPEEKAEESNPVGLFGTTSGSTTLTSNLNFWRDEYRKIIGGVVKRAGSIEANFHFWNPDSMPKAVSAGEVKINGNVVPRYQDAKGVFYAGNGLDATIPLPFDGSYQVFTIAGDAGYPAFVDSVRSPNGATSIAFPMPTDTVSKSAGFTITWNADPTLDGIYVNISDTCRQVGCKRFSKRMEGDPGSLTISAAELATLQPGPITIMVGRGNYKFGEVGTGKKYRLLVYSSQTTEATLRP